MLFKENKYQLLFNKYKNNIYNYSFYMLKNKMDADDVTQEVLIKIWNNMGTFKISSSKSWIIKTTHNLCIDFLRKRSVSLNREYYFDYETEDEPNVKELNERNDVSTIAHLKIMKDKIKDAILRLPNNLKSVFVLYEVEGFKYKEISSALEMPLNSVKVNLMRARKKLQEDLKSYE